MVLFHDEVLIEQVQGKKIKYLIKQKEKEKNYFLKIIYSWY